jgi:hypothetical protein
MITSRAWCGMGCLALGMLLPTARAAEQFDLQQHLGWKIALCYHPMYLLIDEDRGEPVVGERVPPWGAATVEDYAARVRRNLDSLEKDPGLKLNYEWSGYELEDLARRFPDVIQRMVALHKRGQLDFIGGEFSQPHSATLGSESCWRQFEFGLDVFQRVFGKKMTVHATQETQLHPQLPQLLRHFGYDYMAMPAFHGAVLITEGPFELLYQDGIARVKRGDEFIDAAALDGTTIPAYFPANGNANQTLEMMHDLWSCPPVLVWFPDMEEYHNPRQDQAGTTTLAAALDERFKAAPPRAKGQVHTYWSYTEGVWAEELSRNNRTAEEAAVLAGNLLAMARLAGTPADKQGALDGIWHDILKYQHHDVAWIEVTDLRRKAIDCYKKMVADSRALMDDVAAGLVEKNEDSVAVFNSLPRPRKAVLELPIDRLPAGPMFQKIGDRCLGVREVVAGGFKSFPLTQDGWTDSKEAPPPGKIATDHYAVTLSKNGLIQQIAMADGNGLLVDSRYLGGEIRAVIGGQWVDNREASVKFYEGEVCYVLERAAKLGDVPMLERYYFFRHEPAIKAEIEFDFDGNEVGDFHVEESKINVYYPTAASEIYHDVPFGSVPARENEQLLVTNWLYCGGLVYVNRGTPKHWVRDGVVANTLAWGGRQFSNRTHEVWLQAKQYDLRLFGKQKVEYFLIPVGSFDAAAVIRAVEDLTTPVHVVAGRGTASFYAVNDRGLVLTALYEKQGQVWARGYKLPAPEASPYRSWQIFNVSLRDLQ